MRRPALLTGSGVFTANGGQGGSHGGGGGGGRIAVYYGSAAGFSGFASSTANGGTGGQAGGKGTVAFVDTSVPGARFYTYQNFVFPEDSTIAYQAMTTDNSATLTIGGGSIITISETLSIVGNSTLFLQGKNNTSQVSGQWIGEGVTINAGDVTIDNGSKISADGQGYTGVVNAPGQRARRRRRPYQRRGRGRLWRPGRELFDRCRRDCLWVKPRTIGSGLGRRQRHRRKLPGAGWGRRGRDPSGGFRDAHLEWSHYRPGTEFFLR